MTLLDRLPTQLQTTEPGPSAAVDSLPDHLLATIIERLPVRDIATCAQVSRQWRRVAEDPALWRGLAVAEHVGPAVAPRRVTRPRPAIDPQIKLYWWNPVIAAGTGVMTVACCLAAYFGSRAASKHCAQSVCHEVNYLGGFDACVNYYFGLDWGNGLKAPDDPRPNFSCPTAAAVMAPTVVLACLFGVVFVFTSLTTACVIPALYNGTVSNRQARREITRIEAEEAAQLPPKPDSEQRRVIRHCAEREHLASQVYASVAYDRVPDYQWHRFVQRFPGSDVSQGRTPLAEHAYEHRAQQCLLFLSGHGFEITHEALLFLMSNRPWSDIAPHVSMQRVAQLAATLTPGDVIALVQDGCKDFNFLRRVSGERRRYLLTATDLALNTSAIHEAMDRFDSDTLLLLLRWAGVLEGLGAQGIRGAGHVVIDMRGA